MKRQVAIIGPTPEFVRWSIRHVCPIRADLDPASVDATEKRLRSLKAGARAIGEGLVHEGLAIRKDADGQWRGFPIDDVFAPWNGCQRVLDLCRNCIAALRPFTDSGSNSRVARNGKAELYPNIGSEWNAVGACQGWLTDDGVPGIVKRELEEAWSNCPVPVPVPTRPHWYSLWIGGSLSGERLHMASRLFRHVADRATAGEFVSLQTFASALEVACRGELIVDTELVPAGNSDGLRWTIGRHCARCHAPWSETESESAGRKVCDVCGPGGSPHPVIHRKVLGLRPWVPLTRILGATRAEALLQQIGKSAAAE